jgi:hypothetical protein
MRGTRALASFLEARKHDVCVHARMIEQTIRLVLAAVRHSEVMHACESMCEYMAYMCEQMKWQGHEKEIEEQIEGKRKMWLFIESSPLIAL